MSIPSNQIAAAVVSGVLVSCLPRADFESYSTEAASGESSAAKAAAGDETEARTRAVVDLLPDTEGESAATSAGSGATDTGEFAGDARGTPLTPADVDAGASMPADAGATPCGAGGVAGRRGCWSVGTTALSFDEARLACRARGAGWDLAAPKTARLNAELQPLLDAEAWIGGADQAQEGNWVWLVDGTAFWKGDGTTGAAVNGAFSNWLGSEPNGGESSDCLRMFPSTGAWADLQCDQLRVAACRGPAN